jgi:hypothetical protein
MGQKCVYPMSKALQMIISKEKKIILTVADGKSWVFRPFAF